MKFSFSKPKDAGKESDMRVEYAPGKRVFPWVRWYLILFLVLCPLLFFLYRVVTPWFFVDSPAVVTMEQALVTMPRTGRILEILADADTHVKKGSVLFRVEDDTADEKREELVLLRGQLRLTDGRRTSGSAVSRSAIATARASLDNRRSVRKNVEELYRQGAATQAELSQALDDESRAMSALIGLQDRRRSDVALGRNGADAVVLDREKLEAQAAVLEDAIRPKDVVCPMDGRIVDLYATPGETMTQGQTMAVVVNPSKVRITVFANTRAFPFIRDKAVARVSLPGGKEIDAYVESDPLLVQTLPGGIMDFTGGQKVMRVHLVPAEPIPQEYLVEGLPLSVRWGMSFPTKLKRFAKM